MRYKRVFLFVLDSFGIGAMPDAPDFGDGACNTLASVASSELFFAPTLRALGLGNIDGAAIEPTAAPLGAALRLNERSAGKDTVIGHWEIAGYVSPRSLPTYPDGFPPALMERIARATGIEAICNRPYSGTEVLRDFGEEMMRTGKVIVYTSADSVYQVAAHEEVVPVEKLYEYCKTAREILVGEHGVGRVIARPFVGPSPDAFTRTVRRHDYALDVPSVTALDLLTQAGKTVIGVGKIGDIFNMRGITRSYPTGGNAEGMQTVDRLVEEDFEGLCFVNLVDFDMKYGHRRNRDGYAEAISTFDAWLSDFLPKLSEGDVLMITADHGCDPCAPGTDHTRESVPLLVYGTGIHAGSYGTRDGFCDIARTLCTLLGVDSASLDGKDFSRTLLSGYTDQALLEEAKRVMARAYAPYSGFFVGAALLGTSGRIYTGCNIENAAFSPTICAERAAIAQAISAGERQFSAIAVVGGKGGSVDGFTYPCGVCRQVLSEFCPPDFPVLTQNGLGEIETHALSALLPHSFGAGDFT